MRQHSFLILDDEPLILMDLEFACEDRGFCVSAATTNDTALEVIRSGQVIDIAILDVSLSGGSTCVPVANELRVAGIPFILHSGDLDRHDERVRRLDAPLIAKPAAAEDVIAAAIALAMIQRWRS